ncbi:hypothetical protein VRZ08_04095 [Rhodopseudomonas sp. G2_2311]|uniref:hypothetical protein n=1 Tax=Rhodopseudomonas sp. G2_2311 TaxID=3114287 RepID=UPI0039C6B587
MTTAIAAVAATAVPVAAIAATPSIAADGSRPLTESEIVLDDLWIRRRALAGKVQELLSAARATARAEGATPAVIDAAWAAYEAAVRPIIRAVLDFEHEIDALPASINQTGALLLLSLHEFSGRAGESMEEAAALNPEVGAVIRVIEALTPSLAGAVGVDAVDLLSHPDRAISAAPFFT